jgi:hypothetical protein
VEHRIDGTAQLLSGFVRIAAHLNAMGVVNQPVEGAVGQVPDLDYFPFFLRFDQYSFIRWD